MAGITHPARRAVDVAALAPAALLVVVLFLVLLAGSELLGV